MRWVHLCNFKHSLMLPFYWDWNENWHFQSYSHCWVSQICWYIEYSTFTVSSFRIWNNLTGISSAPLALFLVMLPKAHLTSHSRMSLGEWSHHHGYLSHESCHLFLISSASVRSIPFLSFIEPIFAWNVPWVSLIFLKRSPVMSNKGLLDDWYLRYQKYLFFAPCM